MIVDIEFYVRVGGQELRSKLDEHATENDWFKNMNIRFANATRKYTLYNPLYFHNGIICD